MLIIFFPTRNKILPLKKPTEVLVKADRESQFQCLNVKRYFSIRLHQNTNNENWKKMASSSFYILDVVSYQDLSRPSASLAHCCIHDNLYFLAYFAFLNHKCKTKATKTNQVEKKLLKKAVSTALWIHMILFACYLPLFFVFVFLSLVLSLSVHGTRRSS